MNYNTRLLCYRLRKKLGRNHRTPLFALLIVLVYLVANEKYALKLIFEQECFSEKVERDGCLGRTWERYIHRFSESDARLLYVDVNTHCSKVIRLGNWIQDGGWNICADDFQPKSGKKEPNKNMSSDPRWADPCIVYSFGINDDPSFDIDLIRRFKACTIHAFDPSIGRQTGDDFLGPNIKFYSIGLGGADQDDLTTGWEIMTLDSIMKMLNHDHVNLVKMDIEGSEWDTFASWEQTGVHKKIGQLVGEIHLLGYSEEDYLRKVNLLKLLRNQFDFNVFHRDDNFRWSRPSDIPYSEDGKKVRTYSCIELGWKRNSY